MLFMIDSQKSAIRNFNNMFRTDIKKYLNQNGVAFLFVENHDPYPVQMKGTSLRVAPLMNTDCSLYSAKQNEFISKDKVT